MLGPDAIGQTLVEFIEELFQRIQFGKPLFVVNHQQLLDRFPGQIQAGHVDVLRVGHVADGRAHAGDLVAATGQNPFDDAQVLTEARPEELALARRCETN